MFIDFQVKKLALSTQCFKYTTIQGVLFSPNIMTYLQLEAEPGSELWPSKSAVQTFSTNHAVNFVLIDTDSNTNIEGYEV